MAPAPQLAVAAKPAKQHKPLPAPNSDFYELYETLNAEELATVKRVRTFIEAKVAPVITKILDGRWGSVIAEADVLAW
jgi:hypothetical protein